MLGAALAGALALVPVTSASAHDYLVSSTPTADSTVTTPLTSVSLTFNDLVLDLSGDSSSAILEVTGPDAQTTHYETGCASILSHDVSVPVALGAAGRYTMTWQIVSSDGHPVSNSIGFTYSPPAGTAAAMGSATAPSCGGAVDNSRITALPNAAAGGSEAGVNAVLIVSIAGVIVLLAIAGVAVVLVRARRRERASKKL
ncbi:copper resistance protein CopC [Subtercola vilae]|uniref:Copper resistance protein CopC n=1 Tax=Subtercola vilae TaxID=2056433 RepID=A0A4T2BV02_9MICO|nr:copper resistance protein CopC [Subtercola vilae]